MTQTIKKIWYDNNSMPPKNYLWLKGGVVYEYDKAKKKWVEAAFQSGSGSNSGEGGSSENEGGNEGGNPPTPTHDYSQDYFTIEALGNGILSWKLDEYAAYYGAKGKTISYSKNDGEWTEITATTAGVQIDVITDDIIKFKGDNSSGYEDSHFFAGTCNFNVSGNIMSLINSQNFTELVTINSNTAFGTFFNNCTTLIDASNLILPATTLAQSCYRQMFKGCTSLTSAPELLATTLANYCYSSMFSGCTSLNYIKCLATNISASNCTTNWVNGVAATGTFIKNPNMISWTTGDDGIPSGWTVEDAS